MRHLIIEPGRGRRLTLLALGLWMAGVICGLGAAANAQPGGGVLDCTAVLEDQLGRLQSQVTRASRLLRQGSGFGPIVYLIAVHSGFTQEEVTSTREPLQKVAAEAMAARISGKSLGEVRALVAGGHSVQRIILAAGVDPQVALFRINNLNTALNQYLYLLTLGAPDTDGDGVRNLMDPDADGDGEPNWMDLDVDGDGVDNERDLDVDGDGFDNIFDDDVDGDGEINLDDDDVDGDGLANGFDDDSDGDGIEDAADSFIHHGIPNWIDTKLPFPPRDGGAGGGGGGGGGGTGGEGEGDDEEDDGGGNSGPGGGGDDEEDDGGGNSGPGGGGEEEDDEEDDEEEDEEEEEDDGGGNSGPGGGGGNPGPGGGG